MNEINPGIIFFLIATVFFFLVGLAVCVQEHVKREEYIACIKIHDLDACTPLLPANEEKASQ